MAAVALIIVSLTLFDFAPEPDPPRFRQAAEWFSTRPPSEKKVVFNTSWGAYPELRYFGGWGISIVQGQDPVFLQAVDEVGHREAQRALETGTANWDEIIRAFDAHYVVGEHADVRFAVGRVVYSDAEVSIVKLGRE